jgi:hypothetical protein
MSPLPMPALVATHPQGFSAGSTPLFPPGTKVVILQIGTYNDRPNGVSMAENEANVRAAIARVRERGAKVVFVGMSAFSAIPGSYYQYDHIHLTPEGHSLFAQRLLPQVMRAIGSAR